jgi:hypothetical protein
MLQYAFSQTCREFLWLLNWNKHSPGLKTRFILALQQIYLSLWEAKSVLAAINDNLRERRNRLIREFQIYKNYKRFPRLNGCSKDS